MIIDFHVHAFPDDLAPKALKHLVTEAGGIRTFTDGTISDLKRSMDEAGIDVSVIQPVATKPSQVQPINDWLGQVTDERVKAFGAMHPDLCECDRRDAIRQLLDQGVRGVKFHPDYQNFYVDEDRVLPVYEDLFAAGLSVLFHAGIDFALRAPCHCPPDRLLLLHERFPGATLIAAHLGGFYCWDGVEYLLTRTPLFLDTSYALPYLGTARATALVKGHGIDRILFATDTPWASQTQGVRDLEALQLPPDDREAIFSGNARRLLAP